MAVTYSDMVKIEKNTSGLRAHTNTQNMPRYDRPTRSVGTRIKYGDRSIRVGAGVEFQNGTLGSVRAYGNHEFSGQGQVWAQAANIGRTRAWWVVNEIRQAFLVAEPDMIVRTGVGEQAVLVDA